MPGCSGNPGGGVVLDRLVALGFVKSEFAGKYAYLPYGQTTGHGSDLSAQIRKI